MKKQLGTLLLTFIFSLTAVIPGFAANVNIPAADKIKAMEVMLYGSIQEGSLVERMDNIEYDVNGPDPTSGIGNIVSNKQSSIDVYTLQGVLVRKGVKRDEATQGLPQGVYIMGGEKVIVK